MQVSDRGEVNLMLNYREWDHLSDIEEQGILSIKLDGICCIINRLRPDKS